MNMHESYVSLETAKLLKQAGLDWECEQVYYIGDGIDGIIKYGKLCDTKTTILNKKMLICAPTLSVAQRWLREVKKCIIYILPQSMSKYHCVFMRGHEDGVHYSIDWQEFDFPTYEEALEAGIKKCLTLILQKDE